MEDGNNASLPHGSSSSLRVMIKQDRLLCSTHALIGRSILVGIADPHGMASTQNVPIMKCTQKTALQIGERESIGDSAHSQVVGRLTGCRFGPDWWGRAVPMFGTNEFKGSFGGEVNCADGSFTLSASFRGERHILVVGKGKEPVKAIGLNLAVGITDQAGTIDLSDSCPT